MIFTNIIMELDLRNILIRIKSIQGIHALDRITYLRPLSPVSSLFHVTP
jgi:hypothetical protein